MQDVEEEGMKKRRKNLFTPKQAATCDVQADDTTTQYREGLSSPHKINARRANALSTTMSTLALRRQPRPSTHPTRHGCFLLALIFRSCHYHNPHTKQLAGPSVACLSQKVFSRPYYSIVATPRPTASSSLSPETQNAPATLRIIGPRTTSQKAPKRRERL